MLDEGIANSYSFGNLLSFKVDISFKSLYDNINYFKFGNEKGSHLVNLLNDILKEVREEQTECLKYYKLFI